LRIYYQKAFCQCRVLLTVIAAFYGYFTFSDYLTKWYGSIKMDSILIDKLFSEYYSLFIFANYVGILLPGIIIAFPRFRTIPNITIAAIIALLALWVNRYIIVIPTLETPFLPIQDTRPDFIKYTPTWVEWALTMAGVSIFAMLFMLVSKIAPSFPFRRCRKKIKTKSLNNPTAMTSILRKYTRISVVLPACFLLFPDLYRLRKRSL